MPRKQKKYHYIYKTTCNVTNRYYYGMHSTDNLEDGYIGSGKRLWHSINYHGKENHSIEILEYLPNRKSLKTREKELITEDMLKDPMCMNLKTGGDGGGGLWNKDHADKFHKAGGTATRRLLNKRFIERIKKDQELKNRWRKSISKSLKGKASGENNPMFNKKHTIDSRNKMSISNSGSNNSQYGTCWIHNLTFKESKKIKKEDLKIYESQGWIKGRKLKFK